MSDPAQDVKPSPEERAAKLRERFHVSLNSTLVTDAIAAEIRAAQQEARRQAFEEAARWHQVEQQADEGRAEQYRADPDLAGWRDEEDEEDGICDVASHSLSAGYVDAYTNKALTHEVSAAHFRALAERPSGLAGEGE